MNIPPTIIPAKKRVRRKRRAESPSAPPTPPSNDVTVVSVSTVDEDVTWAKWLFTSPVVDVIEQNYLKVAGEFADSSVVITGDGGLIMGYTFPVSAGLSWEAAVGASLVFENGGTLITPESGVVVEG